LFTGLDERVTPLFRQSLLTENVLVSVRRPVARILEDLRDQPNVFREMLFDGSSPTAVMVSSDRRLVHPCNQRGSARRADWSRHKGVSKQHALSGKPIDVRRFDCCFTVAAEMVGHVLDNDPHNIRSTRGLVFGRPAHRREDGQRRQNSGQPAEVIVHFLDSLRDTR
jgi:hypothetical protein